MAQSATNTAAEWYLKVLKEFAVGKTLGDVNMPLIVDLETRILEELRKPADQAAQSAAPPGVQLPPPGPPGMPPGMGPNPGGMGGATPMPQIDPQQLAAMAGAGPR